MKIKRKLYSDIPMTFEVKEIGVDSDGKFAIITAKNDITGEIIEKKMYEKKVYDSEKDFSDTAEEIGAGIGAAGLGAGVGYLGYRGAKNAGETGRVIGDRLSWKKVGDKQLVSRDRTRELGIKVKKAGKKISDFAKTKGGKAALIATPAVIAGGTTYINRRRRRKYDNTKE